jgi:Tol biopolymer transport system component
MGIHIVNIADRKVVRQLPRKGIVQQLVWSADGRWILGTANGLGPFWNIGRLNVASGEINVVSETDRYNCTPDWAANSQEVVYARGIIPEIGGHAEMWVAHGDGREKQMLYAEASRNIYGACASPDGQYLIFTRSIEDLGENDSTQTTLSIIRRRDTPMVGDANATLRQRFPTAKEGPRLDLGKGWEPHWTKMEIGVAH